MGAILAYLARNTRLLLAWSIFVAALAVFYAALTNSGVLSHIESLSSAVVSTVASVASAIPMRVSEVNAAIAYAIQESQGLGQLIFWLCGFDVLENILTYLIAQISTIMSTVTLVGSTALAFAGFLWVIRRAQRWAKATSGGDLNVDAVD